MLRTAVILIVFFLGLLVNVRGKYLCVEETSDKFELRGEWCYHYHEWITYFAEAREICTRMGATLVSIHDAQENDYVTSFTWEVMIGLYYKGNNQFEWTDETPVDYLSLAADFVADSNEMNCVKSVGGKWKNFACDSETHRYVCKKKAAYYPDAPNNVCPDASTVYLIQGEIYSPGYPDAYDASNGFNCQYRLQGTEGDIVVYQFEEGNLRDDNCNVMEIYEGWDATKENLIVTFSDYHLLPVETKSSNKMLVVFKGCGTGTWTATWYSDKSKPDVPTGTTPIPGTTTTHHNSDQCPEDTDITGAGRVVSPGFPFAYDANIECDYNAIVPPPVPINRKEYVTSFEVTFDELNIGDDDWIELIDARSNEVFESTKHKIHDGYTVGMDFNFTVRFHSGNVAGMFNRWVIGISEIGSPRKP